MISLWHHLFHPLHILGFRLDQPLHILLGRRLNGPRPLAKMTPKPTTKGQESLTHPGQYANRLRIGGTVFFNASEDVSFIRYLINLAFRSKLNIIINQIDKSDKVELNTPHHRLADFQDR